MAAVFSFLGIEHVPGIAQACFRTPHEGNGAGDEKIWFTNAVTAGWIGRGVSVPADALSPQLLADINKALAGLGYRVIDERWNTKPGPIDPRAGTDTAPPTAGGHRAPGSEELRAAVRAIEDRIKSSSDMREVTARWPALAGQTIALVVQDVDGGHDELRLSFEPPEIAEAGRDNGDRMLTGDASPSTDGAGVPVAAIIAAPATWVSLLDGEANMAAEIAGGRVRCVNRRDPHRIRSDEVHAVAAVLGNYPPYRLPARPRRPRWPLP